MEIVTQPKPIVRMFYVALSNFNPSVGVASCVADDPGEINELFRDYAMNDIAYVNGDEMKRLMTADLPKSA